MNVGTSVGVFHVLTGLDLDRLDQEWLAAETDTRQS